jgi:hypothetical protein
MAYVALIIGMRGQGKTTFIKNMLKGNPNYVFDVQNEYQEFNPAPHLDRKLFISECIEFTDTFCVFEEATGFFKGRLDEQTDRMILSARHTRNRYIFCFHSIQAVPPGIMNMVNFVVLFKTNDEPRVIKSKYSKLLKPYLILSQKPKYSKLIIQTI